MAVLRDRVGGVYSTTRCRTARPLRRLSIRMGAHDERIDASGARGTDRGLVVIVTVAVVLLVVMMIAYMLFTVQHP